MSGRWLAAAHRCPLASGAAAVPHDHRVAGSLVDVHYHPAARGGELDFPDRAVVPVVGVDLDDRLCGTLAMAICRACVLVICLLTDDTAAAEPAAC
jgi:hypothetical protein